MQSGGRSVGLIVDAAREFLSFDESAIQPPGSGLTGLSGRYLEGVVNIGNRLILVLNLGEVLNFDNPTLAATGRVVLEEQAMARRKTKRPRREFSVRRSIRVWSPRKRNR